MLFTKSEQKTWLNLLAPLRYSNRYLLLLLLKLTFCPKVSYSKSLTLVLSIFGLVVWRHKLRCISRIRNVQFTMPPIFFDNLFNDTTSCFSGTLGLYNFLTSLKCFFNTHLLLFKFEILSFLFTGFQHDLADLSNGIFLKSSWGHTCQNFRSVSQFV